MILWQTVCGTCFASACFVYTQSHRHRSVHCAKVCIYYYYWRVMCVLRSYILNSFRSSFSLPRTFRCSHYRPIVSSASSLLALRKFAVLAIYKLLRFFCFFFCLLKMYRVVIRLAISVHVFALSFSASRPLMHLITFCSSRIDTTQLYFTISIFFSFQVDIDSSFMNGRQTTQQQAKIIIWRKKKTSKVSEKKKKKKLSKFYGYECVYVLRLFCFQITTTIYIYKCICWIHALVKILATSPSPMSRDASCNMNVWYARRMWRKKLL